MAHFTKLLATLQEADAQQRATESIIAASQTSSRDMQIEQALERFRATGLIDFLEREVQSMTESEYWALFRPNGVKGRASMSISFIPTKREQPLVVSYGGRDNICHLGFQSYGNNIRIFQYGPWESLRFEEQRPLDELDATLYEAAYERFVLAAFAKANRRPY